MTTACPRIRGRSLTCPDWQALCALVGVLGERELATTVPTLLLSNGACLVDQPLPLDDIIDGLAGVELPGHTRQLAVRS